MAAVASLTLASAMVGSPVRSDSTAAPVTQWPMCSSSRFRVDGVECLGDRGNLGEDVDAVLVFIDHAGDAADLPFDAAQALEVRLFVGGVTVLGFGRLAAAACAGVRLSRFLGGCVGCGADLVGCAVAALVASGFHGSSIYPRGVYRKGVLRVVTRYGFSCRDFLRREFSLRGCNPCRICAMV